MSQNTDVTFALEGKATIVIAGAALCAAVTG